MAASGKDSNTVMQYEQTLFYEKKKHFQLTPLIS